MTSDILVSIGLIKNLDIQRITNARAALVSSSCWEHLSFVMSCRMQAMDGGQS